MDDASVGNDLVDPATLRDILIQIQGQIARVEDPALLVQVAEKLQIDLEEEIQDDLARLKVLMFGHLLDTDQLAANLDANVIDELYDIFERIVEHLNPGPDDVPVVNDHRRGAVGRGGGSEDDDHGSSVGRGRGRGRGLFAGYGWGGNPFGGPPDIVGRGRGFGFGGGRGAAATTSPGFPAAGVGRGGGGVKAAQSSLFGNMKTSTPNQKNRTAAGQGGNPGGGGVSVVRRLRDFKIQGQIGNPGQTDKLTYSNLAHQVISGQRQGYEPPEIIAAIIRAIVPGLYLRTYLEGRHDWDLPSVMTILRTHYKEKDATAVFTEMGNASQGPEDTEHAFCVRMMGLRDKVMWLTFEEGGFYDERLVQSQFQHALFTGLRSEDARHELRAALRHPGLTDEQLLVHVNEYMMNSVEHQTKTAGSNNTAAVNMLQSSGGGASGGGSRSRADNKAANKEKENTLLAKMDSTADQVNALSARVNELTTLVTNHVVAGAGAGAGQNVGGVVNPVSPVPVATATGGGQTINGFAVGNQNGQEGFFIPFAAFGGGGNQPRRRGLCPLCVAAGTTQCNHCFKCKQAGHQKSDCPN